MKIVYLSIQSADARNMQEPVRRVCAEKGLECELHCANGGEVDGDPLAYHELAERTKTADLVLIRCMTDPTRMKRFGRYEEVLKECPGYVMVFAGNMEVRLMYRDLFKGSDEDFVLLGQYMANRGAENDMAIVCWLNARLTGTGDVPEPVTNRPDGVYHPDFDRDIGLDEYLERNVAGGRPAVGIVFTSNLWIYGNTAHIDALIREFERIDVDVIPVFFGTSMSASPGDEGTKGRVRRYFMDGGRCRVDAIVVSSPFSQLNGSRDCDGIATPDAENFFHTLTGVPVFQAISVNGHYADYEELSGDPGASETQINVYWSEIDGQIITVPIGSVETGKGGIRRFSPVEDRIVHLASMVKGWASLARKPRSERRIAVLMYQSRPESGRIGNAAGLDTVESVSDLLVRLDGSGYTLDHVPGSGKALIEEIQDGLTNDLEWSSPDRIRSLAAGMMDRGEYGEHYAALPGFDRERIESSWGKPPGDVSTDAGRIVVPGLVNGNVFVGYQPLRSWGDQMEAVYHDPVVPMPHSYLGFYRWLKHGFKADLVIHMGTHGTLEWLPGRAVGMSGKCFPDIVLDGIPNIYPYIIDDPGEGIQAKRRSEAVLIGHMCPAMTRAGSYGDIDAVDVALQEYFKSRAYSRGEKRTETVRQVLEAVKAAGLLNDLGLPDGIGPDEFEEHIGDVHDYIVGIRDAVIRDGLHVLGRAPEGERLDEHIYSLTRLPNGDVPSFRDSLGAAMGYDVGVLMDDPSGTTGGEVNGNVLEKVDSALSGLIRDMRLCGYDRDECMGLAETAAGRMTDDLAKAVGFVCGTLSVNLSKMTDEMDNLLRACDGKYVLPGPSGAPTRGNARILPMGRNYYGVDPDIIPTRPSWEVGKRMADQMIGHYMEEKGCYPREVGFVIWATDTMKTDGDDVGYILWLMGVRPVWSAGGQVTDLEVVPLEELGRPRIDVTVRITGLFRDAFPNLIDLIDDAVKLVAGLDESDEENYLAANLRKDIIDSMAAGLTVDEARRRNSVRIFGCPPGGYGPGVNHAVETGEWKTVQDLADIYIEWGSYAYGRGIRAESMRGEFVRRFSKVGVTVKNMPDREIDLLDIDDVYGYLGGMNSFVRAYGNKDAISVMGDGSDPDRTRVRDTKEELMFVYRSKILNPRFVEGLKKHGYRGVAEIANLTEYTFGWDATSDAVDDWMYEKLADTYLFDEDTREWMEDENPHAMMDMVNRLMEAYGRGMWDAEPGTVEKLKDLYLDLEERIEEVNDR